MTSHTLTRFARVFVVIINFVAVSSLLSQEPQRKPEPALTYDQLRTMAEDGVTGFDLQKEADFRSLGFVLSASQAKELLELGVESHVIHHLTLKCLPLNAELDTLVKCFVEQRYDRAIETADLLLDKAPKCLIARWIRGLSYIEKSDWAGALSDFEWCEVEDPNYIPRYTFIERPSRPIVMIGRIHRLAGAPQKAIAVLDRHLAEHSQFAEVDAYLERALAHAARQETLLARADFLASVKTEPFNISVYLNAAEVLTTSQAHRDVASGRSLAIAAVELAGNSTDRYRACHAVAAVEAESANFEAAVEWQQKAIGAAPSYRQQELEGRLAAYRRHETPWPAVVSEKDASTAPIDRFAEIRKSLIEIKAGRFRMGNDRGPADEGPVHEVEVAAFLLASCEVTRGEWRAVMGEGPTSQPNLPIEAVSWEECQLFIERLNKLRKSGSIEFRLPTEAEWEFAARNGTDTLYFFGDDSKELAEYGWSLENSAKTPHSVRTRKPNAAGLFDLYGNVEEWCADPYIRYSRTAEGKPSETGILKVLRGGSWMNPASRCTSSARSAAPAKERKQGAGFRLAANRPSQPEPAIETAGITSPPPKNVTGRDLLDEAVESLWTQYREATQSYLRNRYRTQISQLSLVIAHTRLAEGRSADALASFRRILEVTADPQSLEGWQSRCMVAWIQATCAPELKLVYDPAAAAEAALAAMSQTVFKEWLPYAVLAAAHAESGDFDKAVLRAQQALDQAPADVRDDCRARLELYKDRRTSRGAKPPLILRK